MIELTYSVEEVSTEANKGDMIYTFKGLSGVFRENGVIVGYVDMYMPNDRTQTVLNIQLIEAVEKGQGLGAKFIEVLKREYPLVIKIKGESTQDAYNFWTRQGAEFYDTCVECPLSSTRECPLMDVDILEYCEEYNENLFDIDLQIKDSGSL